MWRLVFGRPGLDRRQAPANPDRAFTGASLPLVAPAPATPPPATPPPPRCFMALAVAERTVTRETRRSVQAPENSSQLLQLLGRVKRLEKSSARSAGGRTRVIGPSGARKTLSANVFRGLATFSAGRAPAIGTRRALPDPCRAPTGGGGRTPSPARTTEARSGPISPAEGGRMPKAAWRISSRPRAALAAHLTATVWQSRPC